MPSQPLDFHRPAAVGVFLQDNLDQLPAEDRGPYRELIEELKERKHTLTPGQLDRVKNFAVVIWPARQTDLPRDEAQARLEAMRLRLRQLREDALRADPAQQDMLLSKLAALEQRIYFDGESIPIEVLDEELQYDRSDAEVPPADEPML